MPVVDNPRDAIENIRRYQTEVQGDKPAAQKLIGRMKQASVWYAVRSGDGESWLFGPSKFIGYADNTAETYINPGDEDRDGRHTEKRLSRCLSQWIDDVPPDTRRGAELKEALREFLERHDAHPKANARIRVLRDVPAAQGVGSEERDRIHIDPAVCGGRPHVRGTRVRVSDILDMLASGVSSSSILTDYPVWRKRTCARALAFGAAASAHRIILAA